MPLQTGSAAAAHTPLNTSLPIRKINDNLAWHLAKQHIYEWVCLAAENIHSTKNKYNTDADDYQIAQLSYLEKPPTVKDIWHLQTALGEIYLINSSDYIQGITGIYPYHQEIHTQEWLILCIEKEIKAHWPQLQIKYLELIDQLPKKIHFWQLNINGDYVDFAANEVVWQKVFKTLHILPKAKMPTQHIPLKLSVLLGQTEITKKQYQKLAKHDIIYLDRAFFNQNGEGFCAVGDWQIELYYQNQHFFFKEWNASSMSKIENPYDEDDDIYEDDDEDNDVDSDSEYDENNDDDNLDSEEDDNDNTDEDDFAEFDGLSDDDNDDHHTKTTHLNADRLNTPQRNIQHSDNDDADDENQTPPHEQDEQTAVMPPFKNIPVLLNFSLGQIKITLAELSELTDGAVLPLASNDAAVTIYANAKAVAKGEVVMIDERLAVQITEIYT